MKRPRRKSPQLSSGTKEEEPSQQRDQWVTEFSSEIHKQGLPWEDAPWKTGAEEPLTVAAVLRALTEIRTSKSRELRPFSDRPSPDNPLDPANWEDVDRPPESAIKVITRALRAGSDGVSLIKAALDLKPSAKGAILARYIARELSKPKGGCVKSCDESDSWNRDTVEWVKPSKQEVERELEIRYPEIYEQLPKKNGAGGNLLRSKFWKDAGLKHAINQARGDK